MRRLPSFVVLCLVGLVVGSTIGTVGSALGVSALVYLPVCALVGFVLGWTHGGSGGWGMGR